MVIGVTWLALIEVDTSVKGINKNYAAQGKHSKI